MTGLRFCFLTTFYPPYNLGGDGIAVERLARALVRRGHHVTVIHDLDAFAALYRGDWPQPSSDSGGVEVISLKSRLGRLSVLLTHQFGRPVTHGRRLRGVFARRRFDVVTFNNVSLLGGPGLLRLGTGAIRLYIAHEHWLVCPSHVLWRHDREVCTGRQCIRCVLRHHRPLQFWRFTGYLERELHHVDAFIALSEFSRNKHREFGFPRPMEVLPCVFPDIQAENPTGLDPSVDAGLPYFLSVGRLERIKGLQDVIPVIAEMSDTRLVIAGAGKYEGALRRLAAGCPRIEFVGKLESDQLASTYRGALGVIAPSLGFETFGLTIVEAFAHGTPVIAREVAGFPELLRFGGGLVFTTRRELRAALQRLRREPAFRARLSDAARTAYREHWTESVVIPQYLEIVQRVARKLDRRDVVEAARGHESSAPDE